MWKSFINKFNAASRIEGVPEWRISIFDTKYKMKTKKAVFTDDNICIERAGYIVKGKFGRKNLFRLSHFLEKFFHE